MVTITKVSLRLGKRGVRRKKRCKNDYVTESFFVVNVLLKC